MIIKKKQMPQAASSRMDAAASAMPVEEVPVEADIPLDWTLENLEAGLVPERRQEDSQGERRRGYRRIEDRDLISKAHEEANAIREQAQAQGFQEGLGQASEVVQSLQDSIANLLRAREDALLSVSREIGALAVEVATRIIKTEVSCDETLVMALVRDTIQKAGRSNKTILIKVNPDDVQIVKKSLKDDPIPNLDAELIVMEEPTVDTGSCIIETNSGLIDAAFSTQLGILQQLFGSTRES